MRTSILEDLDSPNTAQMFSSSALGELYLMIRQKPSNYGEAILLWIQKDALPAYLSDFNHINHNLIPYSDSLGLHISPSRGHVGVLIIYTRQMKSHPKITQINNQNHASPTNSTVPDN